MVLCVFPSHGHWLIRIPIPKTLLPGGSWSMTRSLPSPDFVTGFIPSWCLRRSLSLQPPPSLGHRGPHSGCHGVGLVVTGGAQPYQRVPNCTRCCCWSRCGGLSPKQSNWGAAGSVGREKAGLGMLGGTHIPSPYSWGEVGANLDDADGLSGEVVAGIAEKGQHQRQATVPTG